MFYVLVNSTTSSGSQQVWLECPANDALTAVNFVLFWLDGQSSVHRAGNGSADIIEFRRKLPRNVEAHKVI